MTDSPSRTAGPSAEAPASGSERRISRAAGPTRWCACKADRAAFLIDAAAYFDAFVRVARRAQHSLIILAWDIDSRLELVRDDRNSSPPAPLAEFFDGLLSERPELHIHVLCWDYSMIYTLERELLPRWRMGWATHDRLHFHLDGRHPIGASHHAKVVVVDDAVAFVGGIDLGRRRWDTSRHRPQDRRRVSPSGNAYPPFHDLQVAVSGEAARRLGQLARERWLRATGEGLEPPPASADVWPESLASDLDDVTVGIVRTEAAYEGRPAVDETEAMHRAAIAAADRSIYIENQYLSSAAVADALEERLQESTPPEIVIVLSRNNEGWLEQATMGARRDQLMRRLRRADRHDRLRIYFPGLGDGVTPTVHSKLLLVDDCMAYIGSANLSNRSMGLDTECGLEIDGRGDARVRRALAGLRHRLVAEHLGIPARRLAAMEAEGGGVIQAVDALRGQGRSLYPLEVEDDTPSAPLLPLSKLADPEQPLTVPKLVDELFG